MAGPSRASTTVGPHGWESFVKRYLDPTERLGELLCGLIMVLTITLGASLIVSEGDDTTKKMLLGILGCNVAWGLFYANASLFTEKVRRLVDESPSPVHWLVVDASAITDIDYSAGRAVLELQQDLAKAGVVLGLARINRQDHGNFERLGLAAAIGEDHIFASRRQCIAAYQAAFRDR